MKIGVLAIHGDVVEHLEILKKLGVDSLEVRLPQDLSNKDLKGLIIPGGESTTIMKLINRYGLGKKIISLYKRNKICIFGTCAGAVVLAKKIKNYPKQPTLGLLDIEIDRNGYGRQLESFETKIKIFNKNMNCVFIRAPIISKTSETVQILKYSKSTITSGPILIQDKNILVSTFHPELTNDLQIHKYFLEMCKKL